MHSHHSEDKRSHLNLGTFFLGTLLVVVGVLYFAEASGFLPGDFFLNFVGWQELILPVLLVFFGLSLIEARNVLVKIIGVLFVLFLVGVLALFFVSGRGYVLPGEYYNVGGWFRMPCFSGVRSINNISAPGQQIENSLEGNYPQPL